MKVSDMPGFTQADTSDSVQAKLAENVRRKDEIALVVQAFGPNGSRAISRGSFQNIPLVDPKYVFMYKGTGGDFTVKVSNESGDNIVDYCFNVLDARLEEVDKPQESGFMIYNIAGDSLEIYESKRN